MNIKKLLGIAGAKQATNLQPLVLSDSLCNALEILSQIFGQSWHMPVVGELHRALRSPTPPSGQILAGIILKLLEEANMSRPGIATRFVVSHNQIVYRSADRRYVVLILQGDGHTVRVVWQVSVRQAGTSYISYQVYGSSWSVVDWKVAEPCLNDLALLAKTGGEVLGFLEQYNLLPTGSPFERALDAQVVQASTLREMAIEHKEPSEHKTAGSDPSEPAVAS
ncbi:MAG: hypothetical protein P4L46_13090 [Fimbriimonas sp.]|nr:hypothetical protein [Fimbriimonas sp.]